MPIHDLGYREWKGPLIPEHSRWYVIAETGARRIWQSAWVRRIVFFAWLPSLLFAIGFLIFEWAANGNGTLQMVAVGMTRMFDDTRIDANSVTNMTETLQENRHWFWGRMLHSYLRYPQGFMLVLLMGLIAPRMISEDVSTRAFLFYFSRPLNRFEYVLGKSATLWFYVSMITTVPALFMYLLAVALSASPSVILDTWDILLKIVLGSFAVTVTSTAIALCWSSLTRDSRWAGFAWFAIWIFGTIAVFFRTLLRLRADTFDQDAYYAEHYFSLYSVFGAFQQWVFGIKPTSEVWLFIVEICLIVAITVAILFRRVSAPMRA